MINKAIIVGRLGADVELRYTQNGKPVATFNVATTERWKDQEGQQQESTEWHRITAFGKLAEICGQYMEKGNLVYIEGKIQTRKWTDNNNIERYTTEIIAREAKNMSPRQGQQSWGMPEPPSGGGGYAGNHGTGEDGPF